MPSLTKRVSLKRPIQHLNIRPIARIPDLNIQTNDASSVTHFIRAGRIHTESVAAKFAAKQADLARESLGRSIFGKIQNMDVMGMSN